jgi:hypothetical protein
MYHHLQALTIAGNWAAYVLCLWVLGSVSPLGCLAFPFIPLLLTSMGDYILGLHHLTAIASDPQRNFDFYAKVLGLRFIKKTINFNDPTLTIFTSATS